MCGRYTLRASAKEIGEAFGLLAGLDWKPRYNIAPTQQVLAIVLRDNRRAPELLKWGLIPSRADDPTIGNRMTNARAEGIGSKPSFRSAFRKSRCLVVADGFYEWKKAGKAKRPYLFQMHDGKPFAFAGLAEHWSHGELTIVPVRSSRPHRMNWLRRSKIECQSSWNAETTMRG